MSGLGNEEEDYHILLSRLENLYGDLELKTARAWLTFQDAPIVTERNLVEFAHNLQNLLRTYARNGTSELLFNITKHKLSAASICGLQFRDNERLCKCSKNG